jgi:hypothetical protein
MSCLVRLEECRSEGARNAGFPSGHLRHVGQDLAFSAQELQPRMGGRAAAARVVRGGSWNNNQMNARCACRNRNDPDNYNNNVGFRVVVSIAFPTGRQTPPSTDAGRRPEGRGASPPMRASAARPRSRPPWGAAAGQIAEVGLAPTHPRAPW